MPTPALPEAVKPSVLEAIGSTPLIRLKKASEITGCEIWGKAEFMNPGQSIKDRAALAIIRDAERKGQLRPGGLIVEGTAGNTGIGLAMVGSALGYRCAIVIPRTQSQEKKDAIRLMGAELIEVDAVPYSNPDNYVRYSGRLAEERAKTEPNGAIWANQFDNVANRQGHYETTGPEIWTQTEGRVDGFIVLIPSRKQRDIDTLLAADAPFIVWGVAAPTAGYCSVAGDNLRGGRVATERLIAIGRKRIAFLGGPAAELEVQGRLAGYMEALKRAGLPLDPALIAYADYSFDSGLEATPRLLKDAPDLDAIFANSDRMAMAAINCLRKTGRRVPEDVAVVGYDNLPIAEQSRPPLTTVSQNLRLAGKLLADNLLQYLATRVVTHVCVPVELVIRESA